MWTGWPRPLLRFVLPEPCRRPHRGGLRRWDDGHVGAGVGTARGVEQPQHRRGAEEEQQDRGNVAGYAAALRMTGSDRGILAAEGGNGRGRMGGRLLNVVPAARRRGGTRRCRGPRRRGLADSWRRRPWRPRGLRRTRLRNADFRQQHGRRALMQGRGRLVNGGGGHAGRRSQDRGGLRG